MPKFIPIQDVIKLVTLSSDDILQRSKGRLLTYSKYVWLDMQLSTVKLAKREIFDINKRTNSVTLPQNCLQFSAVHIMDSCGNLYPIFRNDNIHDDIIDIPAQRDCACEYKCGYQLCNTIKGYEAVISTKSDFLPNGNAISFTCVDRKSIDDNGFFYSETQYPQRVYTDGVWTNTILHTEQTQLCQLEIDSNGCVCDTEANINNVCSACGLPANAQFQSVVSGSCTPITCSPALANIPVGGTANCPPLSNINTWIYFCNSKLDWFSYQCGQYNCCNINNTYNISDDGNRLLFPPNFGFGRVLIRYYADINLNDLQIPFVAVDTFVMGLKYWDCKFNDKKQNLAAVYGNNYSKMKWGLFTEINRYRIAEMRMITTPPVFVPSFLPLWGYNDGLGV